MKKRLSLFLLLIATLVVVSVACASAPEDPWEPKPANAEWKRWDGVCLYKNDAGEEKRLEINYELDFEKPKCPDLKKMGWKLLIFRSGFHEVEISE